ncbi:hypothetical protein N8I77_009885 [Diaporthe amygdali]|uniref:ACT-like domain-containing protein n=1 Tax=Phomopsis amygdali TaxID=1214568 RepID=A0AAD9S8R2_PHOAM|nr:hypothetical protein N8I77_009885 [Diaporthe amygdali]
MPSPIQLSVRCIFGCRTVLLGLSLTAPGISANTGTAGPVAPYRLDQQRREWPLSPVTDLSGDELAKSLFDTWSVGFSNVPDGASVHVQLPRKAGSLDKFLNTLRPKYNISLFQYRNSGGDIAKILAGILCLIRR